LTVTAPTITAAAKTYDGTIAATGSSLSGGGVTGFVGADSGSLNSVSLAFDSAHAGSRNVTATSSPTLNFTGTAKGAGTGASAGNEVAGNASDYSFTAPTISAVAATLNAAPLTVTASISAAAKPYDGVLAATGSSISGNTSGAVGTDTVALDTSAISLNFSDAHVVGAKTIGASGNVALGTLSSSGSGDLSGSSTSNRVVSTASDYVLAAQPTISAVAGTITKAPLSVSANNDAKTYSGVAYSGGNGVSYSGFVNSETSSVLGGALAYAGSSQGAKNSGSYVITPQGLTSSNYTVSFVDGTLTINKAHLTVTANDASRIVGQANPVFTATLSGFVNNETPLGAGIGGSAALSTLANAATPASKLPITVAQGSLAARNYDFTVFKDGTLTVKDLFVPPAPPPSAWRRDLPPASDGVGDEDRDGNDEDTLSSLDSHVVR